MSNKLEEHIRIHKMIGVVPSSGTPVGSDSWSRINCNTGFILASDAEEIFTLSGLNGISTIGINSGSNLDIIQIDGSALLPRDGSRAMTGDLDLSNQNILNVSSLDVDLLYADSVTSLTSINGVLWDDIYWTVSGLDNLYVRRDGTSSLSGDWDVGNYSLDNINRLGVGVISPVELIEVDGAIKLGNSLADNDGTIRWTGSDFEGHKAGEWISLTAVSVETASGLDGQIQYNNGGNFAGASSFYYDNVSNRVGIGTDSPSSLLTVSGTDEVLLTATSSNNESTTFNLNNSDASKTFSLMTTGSGSALGGGKFSIFDGTAHRFLINTTGEIWLNELADSPDTPLDSYGGIYAKTDGKLYYKNDSGVEKDLTAEGVPTGSDGQVQYNNGGAFGGGEFYYDDATGFVSIGLPVPTQTLHIARDGEQCQIYVDTFRSTEPVSYLSGRIARGTQASPTNIALGDRMLDLQGTMYINGTYQVGSSIDLRVATSGTLSSSSSPGIINFRTTPNGAMGSARLVRMTIDSEGRVGIGTETPNTTSLLDTYGHLIVGTAASQRTSLRGDSIGINRNQTNGSIFNSGSPAFSIANSGNNLIFQVWSGAGAAIKNPAFAISGTTGTVSVGKAPTTYAFDVAGAVESSGTIRTTGAATPASGSGIEILMSGGSGYIQTYNRSTPGYLPTKIRGNALYLNDNTYKTVIGKNIAPLNTLDVGGATVIGSTYAGVNTASADGLLVQGNVAIGTTSTSVALTVNGEVRLNSKLGTTGNTDLVFARNTVEIAKLTISGFEPATPSLQDLGSPSNPWGDLYLSGSSIYLGATTTLSDIGIGLEISTDTTVHGNLNVDSLINGEDITSLGSDLITTVTGLEGLRDEFEAHTSGPDEHSSYLLEDGSRALSMSWNVGDQEILNIKKLAIGRSDVPSGIMAIEFTTSGIEFIDAGTADATEGGWIEILIGGVTKYIRLYDTK